MARRTLLMLTVGLQVALIVPGWSAGPAKHEGQFPHLMDRYLQRPDWPVAGVDYVVGVAAGTTLRDIAGIRQAGVTVDRERHLIRVSGDNVHLDRYDFSGDGGWGLYVQGAANTTVSNCLFSVGKNNVVPVNADAQSSNLVIEHTTIDGGGLGVTGKPGAIWSLIHDAGTGLRVEYNWLRNAPQHVVEFKDGALVYRNNMISELGFFSDSHMNAIQFTASHVEQASIGYNTIYNTQRAEGNPLHPGEFIQVEAQLGSLITNVEIDHNTLIANGSPPVASYLIAVRQDGRGNEANQINRVSVHDNYLDPSGALGTFYPPTGRDVVFFQNRDLRTGRLLEGPSRP